jgi:hypothetical protein
MFRRVFASAKTERWQNIKAAVAGACATCDANPRLPAAPEPAWLLIMQASAATCDACGLRKKAVTSNLSICKECPAVELLKRLAAAQ